MKSRSDGRVVAGQVTATLCVWLGTAGLNVTPVHGMEANCPPDNSYHLVEPKAGQCRVPATAEAIAKRLEKEALRSFDQDRTEGYEPKIDSEFVRTVSPDGYQVFVLKLRGPTLYSFDHFIVCNRNGDRCAETIPFVCGKWTETFSQDPEVGLGPLLKFATLEGKSVFVVSEVVHNGSVYTGVVDHYYELTPGPTVRQILALESKVYDFRDSDKILTRRLQPEPHGYLIETRVGTRLKLEDARMVGTVSIQRTGPDQPYQVIRGNDRLRGKGDYPLVSIWCSSLDEEDQFLKNGYTFYY